MDKYGNALTAAQIRKLNELAAALAREPEHTADVRQKHEANRTRNARLRAYNLRRSLVARGLLRTV